MTFSHAPLGARDKDRTRRAILDAAERLLVERGRDASIAEIAAAANVSKGGLLHHFPSREALSTAICQDGIDRLWRSVEGLVDETEPAPGRLHRAYVRALTGDSAEAVSVFSRTMIPQLYAGIPQADALLEQDAARWRAAFAADDLCAATSLVVRHAAEGLAAAMGSPFLNAEEIAQSRQELLQLSQANPAAPR